MLSIQAMHIKCDHDEHMTYACDAINTIYKCYHHNIWLATHIERQRASVALYTFYKMRIIVIQWDSSLFKFAWMTFNGLGLMTSYNISTKHVFY